jgi:hypothetical protein
MDGLKKYEITDIAHPRYPWLHRIRARIPVNESVKAGDLGGFVESEQNLSQEGGCWIYDNAVACEKAAVMQEARMFDGTVVRDGCLLSGDACMYERAAAEGNSCILSGEIKEDARIAGNAVIAKEKNGLSPVIGGHSSIYGTVRGWYQIRANVFPGEKLLNPTEDLFILENGSREVLAKQRKLAVPEQYQNEKPKKENRER